MATTMTANFQTRFDSAGVDQFVSGMNKAENAAKNSGREAEASTSKFESLGKRLERPLGRTLFAGLASEMLSANEAGAATSGAMMATERGLHAVGIAAMFAGGGFATIIMIGAALVATILKISSATEKNAESTKKFTDATSASVAELINAKETLGKSNDVRRDELMLIDKAIYAKEAQLKTELGLIKASLEKSEAQKRFILNGQDLIVQESLHMTKQKALAENETEMIDLLKQRAIVQEALNKLNATTDTSAMLGAQAVMTAKLTAATMDMSQARQKDEELQAQINIQTKLAIAETDPIKFKSIQEEIAFLTQLQQAYKDQETVLKLKVASMKTLGQMLYSLAETTGKNLSSAFKKSNGAIILDGAQFASTMIKQAFDMASGQLFARAAVDAFDPLRAGLAPAEFAEAAALSALGGVLSAAVGPDSASVTGSAGGSQSVNSSPSSSSSSKQGASIIINVHDLVTSDNQWMAKFVNLISNTSQTQDVSLVATSIRSGNGVVTPMANIHA